MSNDGNQPSHGAYVPPGLTSSIPHGEIQLNSLSLLQGSHSSQNVQSTVVPSVTNPIFNSSPTITSQPGHLPALATQQYLSGPNHIVHAPSLQINRSWTTSLTDCLRDEESCWWGTWCCFILSARTTETFELGVAREEIYFVIVVAIITMILLHFGLVGIVILIVLGAGLFSAFRRAAVRVGIRHKLSFAGSYFNDFLLHFCCSCCSVCQEAREAKRQNLKILDYCSGQELKDLALPDNFSLTTVTVAEESTSTLPEFSFYPLYFKLSQASQLILKLCGAFFLYISIRLAVLEPASLGILLLVFVQPVLILYFFYWRSRRKNAQLDYVVKLFAVGFFMATTQSMFFEVILQYAITLAAGIIFYFLNPDYFSSSDPQTTQIAPAYFASIIKKFSTRASLHWYSPEQEAIRTLFSGYNSGDGQLDWHSLLMEESTDDAIGGIGKSIVRKNIILLIIVLFLFAFVVAAGVEETMKHFTVRCCRFPAPLKDPHAILVYLMSGALGFATAENIEYVFGTKTSPIHGTSVFIGELFVLFLRICMPIHLICSVLQAANFARVSSSFFKHIT